MILILMTDHYFGTAIMGITAFQAGLGWYHHRRVVLDQPVTRRWFTHVHLWLGRVTILSGMANCGFGLLLVPVNVKWAIFWWIGCGVMTIAYISTRLILQVTGNRVQKQKCMP